MNISNLNWWQSLFVVIVLFIIANFLYFGFAPNEVVIDDSLLPPGYTLDSYSIEKVTDISCTAHTECETPMEYLVQSRCPFTSLCLKSKCTVVCPQYSPQK